MTRQQKILFIIDHILPFCGDSREAFHKYLDKFSDQEMDELIRVHTMNQTNQLTSENLESMNCIVQRHVDEFSFSASPLNYLMN